MRFNRLSLWMLGITILNLAFVPATSAQVVVWKPGQKEFLPAKATAEQAATVSQEKKIVLSATAEPTPALKYLFWKSPALRQPGNVNAMVSRALIMYLSHPNRSGLDSQYAKLSERFTELTDPTAIDDLRAHVATQREILDTLYEACSLDSIELRSTLRSKKGVEVLSANISEVQNLRSLARLVQVDASLAIMEHQYDKAIKAIGAGFRLAEFAKSSGDANLISGLVSIAISGMSFDLVEKLSQQVDAPNLYWALASLPEELWSQRSSIEGESASMSRILYPLLEPAEANMTESNWLNRLVQAAEAVVETNGLSDAMTASSDDKARKSNLATAQLAVGALLLMFTDRGSEELISSGQLADQVQRMSAAEILTRCTQLSFERTRDNLFKWSLLPSHGKVYSGKECQRFSEEMRSDFIVPANVLLGLLVPALQAADSASMRCSTTHKQLLLHEALRAHAAAHNGKLPASLDGLEPVPSWPNPDTQKLFEYQRVSDTEAIVRRKSFYQGDQSESRIQLRAKQ